MEAAEATYSYGMFHKQWQNYKWRYLLLGYLLILLLIISAAYLRLIPTQLAHVPLYDIIGYFVLYGLAGYLAHRAINRRWLRLGPVSRPLGESSSWVAPASKSRYKHYHPCAPFRSKTSLSTAWALPAPVLPIGCGKGLYSTLKMLEREIKTPAVCIGILSRLAAMLAHSKLRFGPNKIGYG